MITASDVTKSTRGEDVILAEQIVSIVNAMETDGGDSERMAVAKDVFSLRLWPTLDQVSITPYHERGADGQYRRHIKWAPTFRGMLALCSRAKELAYIEPVLVLSGDEFSYKDGVVHHSYNPLDEREATPENIRGGYVRIVYRDGRPQRYHFVSRAKIEKNRSCAKRDRVWSEWFQEMALKTLIRDAFCRGALPLSPEMHALAAAIRAEDEYLGNDPDGPMMKGWRSRIENASSVQELESVLEGLLADKSLQPDIRAKLRNAIKEKHRAMVESVPKTPEEAAKVLAAMEDPAEIMEYGKTLVKLGASEDVVELARQRYRAVARTGD